MKTIFNKIQRIGLSLLIAVITAGIVTVAAFAGGPTVRTDGFLVYELGPQTVTLACSGNTCHALKQPNQYATPPESNTLYKWNMGGVSNIY
ncbi:MAG: hypothetical protein WA821_22065, partial [Anaerolineales bacterium]